jgi:hypothetical protein
MPRPGGTIAIAACLRDSDKSDGSITDFCERYADQNQQDDEAFTKGHPKRKPGIPGRRLNGQRTSGRRLAAVLVPAALLPRPRHDRPARR